MPKGFPFFKFLATDWLTGDIVFESMEAQGLFINICALYWQRDGDLSTEDINRRYKLPEVLKLLEGRFLKIDEENKIRVSFLDEQLEDAGYISKKNSEKGLKSAAAKAAKTLENSTTVEPQLTTVQPNSTKKIEIKKEKQSKEDKEKEIDKKKREFVASLSPYLEEFGKETLNDFFRHWAEPNKSLTKLKWELQETWETKLRLIKWKSNEQKFNNGKSKQSTREEKANELSEFINRNISNVINQGSSQ